MADKEFVVVESRVLSGRGLVKIPQDPKWRYFYLLIDLLRPPTPDYRNHIYPISRGEFAKSLYLWNRIVVRERVMRYPRERWDIRSEEEGSQYSPPLVCSFSNVDAQLSAILAVLGVPSVPGEDINYQQVPNPVDEVAFECRDGAALRVELWGLEKDVNCPRAEPGRKTPPPPPPPPDRADPGEEVVVSPPYEGDDDGGFTQPDPIDEVQPPAPDDFPVGNECQLVRVQATFRQTNPDGAQFEFSVDQVFYGVILGERLLAPSGSTSANDYVYQLNSRGRADDGGQCGDQAFYTSASGLGNNIAPGGFELLNRQLTVL